VARSLWRENGSAIYNCGWASPAQSFSGPSPRGLVTIFYCLRFETPPTWRARSPYLYPPGTGWPSYTPRHWVPFSLPPTTCRATVEVFEPASTRGPDLNCHRSGLLHSAGLESSLYSLGAATAENTASNSPFIVMGCYLANARMSLTCSPNVTKQGMFVLAIVA
jgi:hypothetical protein